ncbi:alpha/beta fold hydrolase [Aquisalimonas sp.]|uniref:YheT family hydrolase n=1 Tax=unclassified Aquisalimonas TaxID=2644645 RepID=UPI0025C37BB2|nr:alpha/beta fold hydrolase [Aquisalimonas sp.]
MSTPHSDDTAALRPNQFRAPWWLRGGHAQTLWAGLLRTAPDVPLTADILELPDGDTLHLAWGPSAPGPVVVILHGLGGCARSPYVLGLLDGLTRYGMQGVVMQFRGAGEHLNRHPRFFHAGEIGDLEATVGHVRAALPGRRLGVVGFSMGGIITLNWLGHHGARADADLAITVSTPLQLGPCADYLASGVRRIYDRHLVRGLRQLVRRKQAQQPLPLPRDALGRARSLRQFDEYVTGPVHGFSGADDYYGRCSPFQGLPDIQVPTRMLHALDDPFIPASTLPSAAQLPESVSLEWSAEGGHVGFVAGSHPGRPRYWLDEAVPAMLWQGLAAESAPAEASSVA